MMTALTVASLQKEESGELWSGDDLNEHGCNFFLHLASGIVQLFQLSGSSLHQGS